MIGALALLPVVQAEQTVTVIIDGDAQTTTTRAATVGALLDEVRIPLLEGDTISPELNSRPTQDLVVRISTARSITLTGAGQYQMFAPHLTIPPATPHSTG